MTEKTLRELLEQAEKDLDLYKHPDTEECKERLNAVLVAAGHDTIMRDWLSQVSESGGYFDIVTEWSARGCGNSSDFRIPAWIIDAEDPVQTARVWGLEKKLKEAEKKVVASRTALGHYEEEAAKLRAELEKAKTNG